MVDQDESDLEAWIRAFRGPLIGFLASLGHGWGGAEELTQEVFAEAWLARERFRADPADPAAVGAWLRGIAIRLSSAEHRRAPRAVLISDEPAVREADAADALAAERRERLRAAFAELREPHQTVLRMHYLEETSAREVAALLGLTPKAVEDRLYQARKALRALVERRDAQGVRP